MDRRVMPVGVQDFEDLRRKGYICGQDRVCLESCK